MLKGRIVQVVFVSTLLVGLSGFAGVRAQATQTTTSITPEELASLKPELAGRILAIQVENERLRKRGFGLEDVEELLHVGEKAGAATKGFLEGLGEFANDFMRTPAGLFVAGVIAWSVAGPEVVDIIRGPLFGIPLWIAITWILIWVYRRNCLAQRVVVSSEGAWFNRKRTYQMQEPLLDGDSYTTTAWAIAILWTLFTIVMLVLVF